MEESLIQTMSLRKARTSGVQICTAHVESVTARCWFESKGISLQVIKASLLLVSVPFTWPPPHVAKDGFLPTPWISPPFACFLIHLTTPNAEEKLLCL